MIQCAGVAEAGGLCSIVAFGTVFGPHITFAAGVAAAAYARKAGKLDSGCELGLGLASLGEPAVLAVGGLFGVLGWAMGTYLIPFLFGTLIPVGTDNPGLTVLISGIIARLAFGERGLSSARPALLSAGKALQMVLLRAAACSLMVGGTGVALHTAGIDISGYNIIIFGCAAVTLLFRGNASWHHTGIISAYAAMVGLGAGLGDGAVVLLALVCGVAAALLCDFEYRMFNTDVDSHIDGEAFAISVMTVAVNLIAGIL